MSKAELALYAVLIVGVLAGLAYDVPKWILLVGGVVAGLVNALLPNARTAPAPEDTRWPWRRPWFWLALVAIAVLAVVLDHFGASPGINIFICSLPLIVHMYVTARQVERVRELASGVRKRGPTVEDWALLTVSLIFCAGALLFIRDDWRMATTTLVFFGACALTFVAIIRRKRRAMRPMTSVSVVGGVNIYAEGQRMLPIAVGCTIVGSVWFFIDIGAPLLIRLMGAFVALVGVVLLVMISLGLYTRKFIRFEYEAFIVGEQKYRLRIEWDTIAAVQLLEYANNPFVVLRIADAGRVAVEPAHRRAQALSDMTGGDEDDIIYSVHLQTQLFGIDAPVLAAALGRYATDVSARRELAIRYLEAGR